MAISLNSIVALNSTLQAKSHNVSRYSINASASKLTQLASPFWVYGLGRPLKEKSLLLPCSVADSDRLATGSGDMGTGNAKNYVSDSTVRPSSSDSLGQSGKIQTIVGDKSGSQTSDTLNGSIVSSDLKQEVSQSPNLQFTAKRSPLTARERLRAARVLSRYNETKVSKSSMGIKVLDALTEGDKGKKRSGLPEAPTNLFDDSKRGLPKQGLTFQFPGAPHVSVSPDSIHLHGCPPWSINPAEAVAEDKAASVSKSHSQAEKRRRDRINAQLATLRKLIPKSDKMDKAALLGSVIEQVKDLKRKATEVSKAISVPTEVDEVTVDNCVQDSKGNESSSFFRATVCCEDRPEVLSELVRVLKGLKLSTVKADISSVGGRMRSNLVLCSSSKGSVSISTLKHSLNVFLTRIASSSVTSNCRIRSKRQRLFLPSNFSHQ